MEEISCFKAVLKIFALFQFTFKSYFVKDYPRSNFLDLQLSCGHIFLLKSDESKL